MRIILSFSSLISLVSLLLVSGCGSKPKSPGTRLNAKDGAEMVLIPVGDFLMGTSQAYLDVWRKRHPEDKQAWFADESPQHSVFLDSYYIYKTEVTVAQYRKFCKVTGRKMPDAPLWGWQDKQPIVNVSFEDARAYAEWAGAELPSEAEWEKAARGIDGRTYPWGSAWNVNKSCNSSGSNHRGQPSPVGSFPSDVSTYGVMDMAGNVMEWCADQYGSNYYAQSPQRNPPGQAYSFWRVVRGGAWNLNDPELFRAAVRFQYKSPEKVFNVGFRCVSRTIP